MKDWQERLLQEAKDLQDKITSLSKFILTSDDDKVLNLELLQFQLQAMCLYHSILIERIKKLFDITMCKTNAQIHEWIDEQLAKLEENEVEVHYVTSIDAEELRNTIAQMIKLMGKVTKDLKEEK